MDDFQLIGDEEGPSAADYDEVVAIVHEGREQKRRGRPPKSDNAPRSSNAEASRAYRERKKAAALGGNVDNKVHTLFSDAIPKAPKPRAKRNLEAAQMSLQMAHIAIAAKIGDDGFMLSDDEAHMLADAGANLLEYYNVKLSGKNGALLMMAQAIAVVYGPRLFKLFFAGKFAAK